MPRKEDIGGGCCCGCKSDARSVRIELLCMNRVAEQRMRRPELDLSSSSIRAWEIVSLEYV